MKNNKIVLLILLSFFSFNGYAQNDFSPIYVNNKKADHKNNSPQIVHIDDQKIIVLNFLTHKVVSDFLSLIHYSPNLEVIRTIEFPAVPDGKSFIFHIEKLDSSVVVFYNEFLVPTPEGRRNQILQAEWNIFTGKLTAEPKIFASWKELKGNKEPEHIEIRKAEDGSYRGVVVLKDYILGFDKSGMVFMQETEEEGPQFADMTTDQKFLFAYLQKNINILEVKDGNVLKKIEIPVNEKEIEVVKFLPSENDGIHLLAFENSKEHIPTLLFYKLSEKGEILSTKSVVLSDKILQELASYDDKKTIRNLSLIAGFQDSEKGLTLILESRIGKYNKEFNSIVNIRQGFSDIRYPEIHYTNIFNEHIQNTPFNYKNGKIYHHPTRIYTNSGVVNVAGGNTNGVGGRFGNGPTLVLKIDSTRSGFSWSQIVKGYSYITNLWDVVHPQLLANNEGLKFRYVASADLSLARIYPYREEKEIQIKEVCLTWSGAKTEKTIFRRAKNEGLQFYRIPTYREYQNKGFIIGVKDSDLYLSKFKIN